MGKVGRPLKLDEKQRAAVTEHLTARTRTVRELAADYGVHQDTIRKYLPPERKGPPRIQNLDLKGKVFGSWTVLGKALNRSTASGSYWDCECACGTLSTVRGITLTKGRSTQCLVCRNGRVGEPRPLVRKKRGPRPSGR